MPDYKCWEVFANFGRLRRQQDKQRCQQEQLRKANELEREFIENAIATDERITPSAATALREALENARKKTNLTK
ncbi:hypothetical protein [Buttiauxella brennerae]|uniref:hypothetical protein n=1 Tax=Buttiauxella brennerae TaxID=82988 RepID=UPI00286F2365|nr:hypothetical protein [Buttiauxella brennerae]